MSDDDIDPNTSLGEILQRFLGGKGPPGLEFVLAEQERWSDQHVWSTKRWLSTDPKDGNIGWVHARIDIFNQSPAMIFTLWNGDMDAPPFTVAYRMEIFPEKGDPVGSLEVLSSVLNELAVRARSAQTDMQQMQERAKQMAQAAATHETETEQ